MCLYVNMDYPFQSYVATFGRQLMVAHRASFAISADQEL